MVYPVAMAWCGRRSCKRICAPCGRHHLCLPDKMLLNSSCAGLSLRLSYHPTRCCTGGTFKTHGLLYDNTYDRSLYAPGNSNCTGPSGYRVPAPPCTMPLVLAGSVVAGRMLRPCRRHCSCDWRARCVVMGRDMRLLI